MAKKKTTKPKEAELKKFCVTKVIYVTLDVHAKDEEEAKDVFALVCEDIHDYQHLLDQANEEIEVQQYE